jgi:hypothetical protein
MGQEYKSCYCTTCHKQVRAERPGTNHVLHLLLSIFTFGLWLICWIMACIKFGGWQCPNCGGTELEDGPRRHPSATNLAVKARDQSVSATPCHEPRGNSHERTGPRCYSDGSFQCRLLPTLNCRTQQAADRPVRL